LLHDDITSVSSALPVFQGISNSLNKRRIGSLRVTPVSGRRDHVEHGGQVSAHCARQWYHLFIVGVSVAFA
jgi:hypothetical protein